MSLAIIIAEMEAKAKAASAIANGHPLPLTGSNLDSFKADMATVDTKAVAAIADDYYNSLTESPVTMPYGGAPSPEYTNSIDAAATEVKNSHDQEGDPQYELDRLAAIRDNVENANNEIS